MDADILNAKQAAEFLGMHERTLKAHAAKGVLPGHKVGRQWRFSRVMLKRWFDRVGLDKYDLVTRLAIEDFCEAASDLKLMLCERYVSSQLAVTLSPKAMSALNMALSTGPMAIPAMPIMSDIAKMFTNTGEVLVSVANIQPAGIDFILTADTGHNKQVWVWGLLGDAPGEGAARPGLTFNQAGAIVRRDHEQARRRRGWEGFIYVASDGLYRSTGGASTTNEDIAANDWEVFPVTEGGMPLAAGEGAAK